MADQFLNKTGLIRLWAKIKAHMENTFFKLTGGTVTGNIDIRQNTDTNATLRMYSNEDSNGYRAYGAIFKSANSSADNGVRIADVLRSPDGKDNRMTFVLKRNSALNSSVLFTWTVNGTSTAYYLFGTHNPPAVANVIGLQAALDEKAAEADIDLLYSAAIYGPDEFVTFDGKIEGMPLQSCLAEINAVQEGSGDPSPSNIRPISGWTGANVSVVDADNPIQISASQAGSGDPSPQNVRPFTPGLTLIRDDGSTLEVYGGSLDAGSGVLTVTHKEATFDGIENWKESGASGIPTGFSRFYLSGGFADCVYSGGNGNPVGVELQSSHYPIGRTANSELNDLGAVFAMAIGVSQGSTTVIVQISDSITDDTLTGFKAWVGAQYTEGTPLQVVYPLAIPITYQLTPQEVARALTSLGYAAEHYPVSWQTEAGTVYGGTLDALSGVLTVTHGYVTFDGTEAWNRSGTDPMFWCTLDSLGPAAKGDSGVFSHLPYNVVTTGNTETGARVGVNNGSTRIYLRYAGMPSTVADWQATLAQWYADGTPFQAVYEMAEPVTYQLTPQAITALAGENHIWADTGDVTVEYGAFLQKMWEEIGKG